MEIRGMVGGRDRHQWGSSAGVGVERLGRAECAWSWRAKLFVLKARTKKDKLGPCECFSRGWNPAQQVSERRKQIGGINIGVEPSLNMRADDLCSIFNCELKSVLLFFLHIPQGILPFPRD